MARLVTGDRSVAGMMMFGAPDPYLMQYLNQVNHHFNSVLTDVGRQFADAARGMFARMESSEALRLARAAMRKVNAFGQIDVIHSVNTIEQLQEAPNAMIPWIMTHPTLRQYHYDNRIDAYGNRYVDPTPGVIGWVQPEYAAVYGGWLNQVVETKVNETTGEEETEHFVEWSIPLEDEDDPFAPQLLDEEALMIQQAHNIVDMALHENRDPTSYYDNQIV